MNVLSKYTQNIFLIFYIFIRIKCGRVDVAHDSFIPIMIDNVSLILVCEL